MLKSYQAVRLFRPGATSGAEEVTTFSRFRPEAPTLVTLRAAVDLRELLAVLRTFAPAAGCARLVAGGAVPLGFVELVVVNVLGVGAGDDLLPLDGLDVAQVVVVQYADTTLQDICEKKR